MTTENSNTLPHKQFGYRIVEKPKHAEEHSTEESLAFTPWKITLKVETCKDEPEPVDYDIYLRSPDPAKAQWLAYGAFMKWEHHAKGIPTEDWPRVSELVPSEAQKLTEKMYMQMWKYAQLHPCYFAGMRENPYIFRFTTPEWLEVLERRRRRSVLISKKIGMDVVAKKKAEIDAKLKKM